MSTPKRLSTVLKRLDEIPYINNGGCGISALAIYRWCKAHNVPVSERPFVIIDDDTYGIKHNEVECKNGNFAEIYVPHIVIEINGELVDSGGVGDDSPLIERLPYRQEYQLNEDELLERINNTGRWNDTFNRNKYLDVIANRIGVDLDDVDWQ